ncbi:MAG TPA: hypothetical protein VFP64_13740, partial [Pyrinomonadaceae bacterium]|nr:hypothetical protein [Pyrinomonadaceae bacterium]
MLTPTLFRVLLLTVALFVLSSSQTFAQGPCDAPCSDPACVARNVECHLRLNLYRTYMARLGEGVALHSLPQSYLDVLNPWFLGPDLRNWRFGFSDRQRSGTATTDCSITYFNDRQFVDTLRVGRLSQDSNFEWLFHELQHFVQCNNRRDWYAARWFMELPTAIVQGGDLKAIHDRMPMEGDADTVADRVL